MNSHTERLTVVEKLAQLDEVRLCKLLLDYCFFLGAVEIATDADCDVRPENSSKIG